MGFRPKSYSIAGLAFLLSTHFVGAKTIGPDNQEITILVYNAAAVSPADLARSEQQAAMIFHEAGIKTTWIDCSAGCVEAACHQIAGPNQFVLHIVPRGQTSTEAVFGVAFLGADGAGKYTDVFYNRVEQMHRDFGSSRALLLGTVAAHEIGHLLLGSNSHSASGIMAAHWKAEELQRLGRGCLSFTSEQASRMRARIDEQDGQKREDNWRLASAGARDGTPRQLSRAFSRQY
jgi:hypothetical protein